MIDVVTVPDFSGQAARTFEARTLLFLASWMANAGKARSWPLHLACIGQPPAGGLGANREISTSGVGLPRS